MAVRIASFIRDEDAISIHDEMDEVEPLDDLAVRPAATEVRFTVEPIVERAREVKVVGEQGLEGCPVFRHIRPVGRLCNRRVRGWRRRGALSDHGLLLCERSADARFKPTDEHQAAVLDSLGAVAGLWIPRLAKYST